MERIYTKTHNKRIYLDDSDNYIDLNFNDSTLPARFYSMVERIQNRTTSEEKKAGSLSEEDVKGTLETLANVQKPIGEEIDAFFGEGTCMKIWGCNNPAFDLCMNFFEQLSPLFEKYAKDFSDSLNKYSPGRTGNV